MGADAAPDGSCIACAACAAGFPGTPAGDLITAKNREIAELRARIAGLQGEQDSKGDYQVHVVPGPAHLPEAMASLTDAREGDKLRVVGTDIELEYRAGIWGARPSLTGIE